MRGTFGKPGPCVASHEERVDTEAMRTLTGEVADDLTVDDSLTIQGLLSGDSQVIGGGHLVVQGTVIGRVEVEAEGSLHIQGTGGFPLVNRGLVMLAGTFDEDWLNEVAGGDGTVVVWSGSLITRHVGLPFLVNGDGTQSLVDGSSTPSISINADPEGGLLVYRDEKFTPVSSSTDV